MDPLDEDFQRLGHVMQLDRRPKRLRPNPQRIPLAAGQFPLERLNLRLVPQIDVSSFIHSSGQKSNCPEPSLQLLGEHCLPGSGKATNDHQSSLARHQ